MRSNVWPLCLLLLSGLVLADDGDVYRTPHYKPGHVVKIKITKATVRSDYDPQESCDTFVITPKLATYFFNHSRVTSERYFSHDSEYSSCSAEGEVKFSNGDEGTWTIYRNGRGLLGVTNGQRGGEAYFFHCTRCEDWAI